MEKEISLLRQKRKGGVIKLDENEIKKTEVFKKVIKNKRPNRKRLIKSRLEFFLSDINLLRDNYLRKIYMSNNYGITPEIFLTFKSIMCLISDIEKSENRKDIIIKAVEISNKILYDKNTNLIKRKTKFNIKEIDTENIDACTVFVDCLPQQILVEDIFDMFSKYKIEYVSIIKKKDKKNKNLKNNENFLGENSKNYKQAFITFKTPEIAKNFIKECDNFVPKFNLNLLKKNNKEINALKVISKKEWIENKIKLNKEKISYNIIRKNNIDLNLNVLIEINNLIDNIKLIPFKNALSKYCAVLFIELNREKNSAIIRVLNENEYQKLIQIFDSINEHEDIKIFFKFNKDDINNKNENIKVNYNVFNEKDKENYINKVKKSIDDFHNKKLAMKVSALTLEEIDDDQNVFEDKSKHDEIKEKSKDSVTTEEIAVDKNNLEQ